MHQNLQLFENKPALFPQLIKQLEKDLDCKLKSQNIAALCEELEKTVEIRLKNPDFMQQLYQVDVPEKKLLNVLHSEDAVRSVTELILLREAQKVLFRFQYHQK